MGYDACMPYIMQRSDCDSCAPAKGIDPEYAEALESAIQHGVHVFAGKFKVRQEGICFLERLPLGMEGDR